MADKMVDTTLDAGEIVKVNGIPVMLTHNITVRVNLENLDLIHPSSQTTDKSQFTDKQIKEIEQRARSVICKTLTGLNL